MKQPQQCDDEEGCDRPAVKRGKCNKHYLRYVRSTPKAERSAPPRETITDLERFYSFVNKVGPIATNNPELGRCHIWTGGTTRGYGIFWADGTSHRAHVWIYKQAGGVLPPGMTLDHFACDQTLCVNREHVRPATHRVNILRSGGPAGVNARKTHCGTCGRMYDEANTLIHGGRRYCRYCKRKREREAARARRSAAKAAAST